MLESAINRVIVLSICLSWKFLIKYVNVKSRTVYIQETCEIDFLIFPKTTINF